jgi:hypothetical protein
VGSRILSNLCPVEKRLQSVRRDVPSIVASNVKIILVAIRHQKSSAAISVLAVEKAKATAEVRPEIHT